MCSFLTAHSMASASHSVWEYRCFTGESSTGICYNLPVLFTESLCTNIADNPVGEASVVSSVSLFWSKYTITFALVSSFLICWKDYSCWWDQWNCLPFFVISLRAADTSLKFGINFAQYVAMPRKLRIPLTVVGAGALLIASTFLGSGAIPLSENTNPKKVSDAL